jgi:hypothetical protein
LDRLLKDIVAETASVYIPVYPETEKVRDEREENRGILVPYPDGSSGEDFSEAKKAFSLAHFIPLLRERIYVVSPFTRSYLVSWIAVLDSVPELELISYLPEFFDGLLSVHAILEILLHLHFLLENICQIQQKTSVLLLKTFLVNFFGRSAVSASCNASLETRSRPRHLQRLFETLFKNGYQTLRWTPRSDQCLSMRMTTIQIMTMSPRSRMTLYRMTMSEAPAVRSQTV